MWERLRNDPDWQFPDVHYEPYQTYSATPLVSNFRHAQNLLFGHVNRIESLAVQGDRLRHVYPPMYLLDRLLVRRLTPIGRPVLRFCERWNRRLVPQNAYAHVFRRFRPDLVLSTHPYLPMEWPLLSAAVNRGVRLVCAVLNWDQMTTRGRLWVRPDRVLVWNPLLKQFAEDYYPFLKDGDVVATGALQFDHYAHPELLDDRRTFLKRMGADPDRRVVTFMGAAPRITPKAPELLDMLYQPVRDGRIGGNPNFVFRPHPKDPRQRYEKLLAQTDIVFQEPGPASDLADRWLPDRRAMIDFGNLLEHSDVIINPLSTVSIDAAAFDTPSICTVFDGHENLPMHLSIRRFLRYTHLQALFDTRGLRVAHSIDQCIEQTRAYLADPTRDAAGRQLVRQRHCYRLDGRSAERFVAAIGDLL